MLEVKNISSGYWKKKVLYDISFEVNQGEIVLLTGGNGSGKSTILKCVFNLLPLWSGNIHFKGEKLSGINTSGLIKKGLVYIPQKNNYFENLTTHENLQVSGSTYSNQVIHERIDNVYQNIDKLKQFEYRTPFNMSGGERQLVALGNALMHKPELIMFDEPFAGLDNQNTNLILQEILRLNKVDKIAFLIVEHIKSFPDNFFNRNIHITLGKII
jgi:branched-chain amino acid transport system ATP-binding protein